MIRFIEWHQDWAVFQRFLKKAGAHNPSVPDLGWSLAKTPHGDVWFLSADMHHDPGDEDRS